MLGHMECKRCGCEVERERDAVVSVAYPWYCPACDEGRTVWEVEFVENAPFEQARWGFVDEDTMVTAWTVEDVFEVAPDLTIEDAREVLRVALERFDANVGINWDVLAVWADYIKEGN